jgi:hypothetical protein
MSDATKQIETGSVAKADESFADMARECWHQSNSAISESTALAAGWVGSKVGLADLDKLLLRAPYASQSRGLFTIARPIVIGLGVGYATASAGLTVGCMLDRYDNHLADYLLMAM